jgi:hypothetical protein
MEPVERRTPELEIGSRCFLADRREHNTLCHRQYLGWTVITVVCAAGNSNASQFAFGVPAKAAAVVGLRV